MSTDTAVTTLNQLIAIAVDGVEGFELAADKADDPQVAALFVQLAAGREAVVAELQGEVRRLGGKPESEGTLSGAAHRAFTSFKSAIAGLDRAALLKETDRGESHAVERFEQALQTEDLPAEVRTLIEAQLTEIRRSRESVASMARIKS